jgi:uncharacterized protein YukE
MADTIRYVDAELLEFANACQQLAQDLQQHQSKFASIAQQLESDLFKGRAGDVMKDLIAAKFCHSLGDLADYTHNLGQRVSKAAQDMQAADHR